MDIFIPFKAFRFWKRKYARKQSIMIKIVKEMDSRDNMVSIKFLHLFDWVTACPDIW